MQNHAISIIIPSLNEEKNLSKLLPYLEKNANHKLEVIVVDAGSEDNTKTVCEVNKTKFILSPEKSRPLQMNLGASVATHPILYFVHADCIPPTSFSDDIIRGINNGYELGGYQSEFDSNSKLLKFNAYLTRFNKLAFRGGDQSLYITQKAFQELSGFKADHIVMEEYDLMKRAKNKFKFLVMPKSVLISARKYEENSYLRVNTANFIIFTAWRLGVKPITLKKWYQNLIKHPKAT